MKMQSLFVGGVLVLVSGTVCAMPPDLPRRKAGQWELTVETSARAGHPTVMEQCVDDNTDVELQKNVLGMREKSDCTKNEFHKTSTGYEANAVCNMGGTTVTSHSVTTGDLSSAYQINIDASYNPPLMGMSQTKTTIKARLLGACKAGMVPGDVSLNGVKIGNMTGLTGGGKQSSGAKSK